MVEARKIKIGILFFLQLGAALLRAQDRPSLQKLMPKRFIDKVEIIAGPSLNIPNDHGYSDYIKNAPSTLPATDDLKIKIGYSGGLGLAHSIGKRLEMHGRILWERKGCKEEATDGVINNFHKGVYDTNNDYLTVFLLPRIYLGKSFRFHFFSGAYYSWLLKSFRKQYTYLNGQLIQFTSATNDPSIHKYEVGICTGVGYSFKLGTTHDLLIQMQGSYGLSDIVNVNRIRITGSSISLSAVYKYNRQFKIKLKTN